jgi:hypothetical protein
MNRDMAMSVRIGMHADARTWRQFVAPAAGEGKGAKGQAKSGYGYFKQKRKR